MLPYTSPHILHSYENKPMLRHPHYCIVCNKNVDLFLPYRPNSELPSSYIKRLQVVGSDINNFFCPHCRCTDRERHLFLYFDKLKIWKNMKGTVLHIAPEWNLSQKIISLNPVQYIRGDLSPRHKGVLPIDVTDIDISNNTIDIVICNHVLEHINDIQKGLTELHRVLKPNGIAILQTPFSRLLHQTFEDPGINSGALRLFFYGQEDHVRMFGKNIIEIISSFGFSVQKIHHRQVLSEFNHKKYGINPEEPLILATKKN